MKKIAALLATLMVGAAANSACLAISGADVVITGTVDLRYSNANDKGMYTFDGSDVDTNGYYHRTDINLFVPVSKDVSFTGSVFAGSRNAASDRFDNTSVTMVYLLRS
ncbi:hypothetical protein [Sporomusa acidovorans]|nr:hypothetical protein [Sporomusa acidovorans]